PLAIEAVERFWHVAIPNFLAEGNERQCITCKGAGAVISAVRSLRRTGEAGAALVSAQFACHADRWRGCPGHREFLRRIPDRQRANLLRCNGRSGARRAYAADRRKIERRTRWRDAFFGDRFRPGVG